MNRKKRKMNGIDKGFQLTDVGETFLLLETIYSVDPSTILGLEARFARLTEQENRFSEDEKELFELTRMHLNLFPKIIKEHRRKDHRFRSFLKLLGKKLAYESRNESARERLNEVLYRVYGIESASKHQMQWEDETIDSVMNRLKSKPPCKFYVKDKSGKLHVFDPKLSSFYSSKYKDLLKEREKLTQQIFGKSPNELKVKNRILSRLSYIEAKLKCDECLHHAALKAIAKMTGESFKKVSDRVRKRRSRALKKSARKHTK